MSWSAAVVAHLVHLRRQGVTDFAAAWDLAIQAHPPSMRDKYGQGPLTLLEQPEESLVDFTRRVCADAWTGRRSVLRFLPMGAFDLDSERPARKRFPA